MAVGYSAGFGYLDKNNDGSWRGDSEYDGSRSSDRPASLAAVQTPRQVDSEVGSIEGTNGLRHSGNRESLYSAGSNFSEVQKWKACPDDTSSTSSVYSLFHQPSVHNNYGRLHQKRSETNTASDQAYSQSQYQDGIPSENGSLRYGQLRHNQPSEVGSTRQHLGQHWQGQHQSSSSSSGSEVVDYTYSYLDQYQEEDRKARDELALLIASTSESARSPHQGVEEWAMISENSIVHEGDIDTLSDTLSTKLKVAPSKQSWINHHSKPVPQVETDLVQWEEMRLKKDIHNLIPSLDTAQTQKRFPLNYGQLGLTHRRTDGKTIVEVLKIRVKSSIDSGFKEPKLTVGQVRDCLLLLSDYYDRECLELHQKACIVNSRYSRNLGTSVESFRRQLLLNLQTTHKDSAQPEVQRGDNFNKIALVGGDQTVYVKSLTESYACIEFVLELLKQGHGLSKVIKINDVPLSGEQLVMLQGRRGLNINNPSCTIDIEHMETTTQENIQIVINTGKCSNSGQDIFPAEFKSRAALEDMIKYMAEHPLSYTSTYSIDKIKAVLTSLEQAASTVHESKDLSAEQKVEICAYFNKLSLCIEYLHKGKKGGITVYEVQQYINPQVTEPRNISAQGPSRLSYDHLDRLEYLEEGSRDVEPHCLQSLNITTGVEMENNLKQMRSLSTRVHEVEKARMKELFSQREKGSMEFFVKTLIGKTIHFHVSTDASVAEFALRIVQAEPMFDLWSLGIIFEGNDISTPELMSKRISDGALQFYNVTTVHAVMKQAGGSIKKRALGMINPVTRQPYLRENLQNSKLLERKARLALEQIEQGKCEVPVREFFEIRCGLKGIQQQLQRHRGNKAELSREERYIGNLLSCFEIFKPPYIGSQNAAFDDAIESLAVNMSNKEARYSAMSAEELIHELQKNTLPMGNKNNQVANECLVHLLIGAKFNCLTVEQLQRVQSCIHEQLTVEVKQHITWIQESLMTAPLQAQYEGIKPTSRQAQGRGWKSGDLPRTGLLHYFFGK